MTSVQYSVLTNTKLIFRVDIEGNNNNNNNTSLENNQPTRTEQF